MFRVQSIKRKLQLWVVAIFVLTGTAGWAGIWGLLYISNASKEASGGQLERARDLTTLQGDLAAARRLDRDLVLLEAPKANVAPAVEAPANLPVLGPKATDKEREAAAAAVAAATAVAAEKAVADRAAFDQAFAEVITKRREQGARLQAAWERIADDVKKLREGGLDGAKADELAATQARVIAAASALVAAAVEGRSAADLEAGPLADYDARATQLDKLAADLADAAFVAVRTQTTRLFDWIWVLQLALFVTVAAAQGFSAWAGWQLSRTLAAQLTGLKDSAERISLGDLKSEVKIPSADTEIVEVGEALDRLRVSLGKAMDRLSARRAAAAPAAPPPEAQG